MSDLGKRKERIGIVVSDKMNKTRVVRVERLARHRDYDKIMKMANKFKAHDEKNASKTGDRVRIVETRPLSKDKRWRIVEVLPAA
ncbi:MAG: 30S ribosomal protein S17 [Candidatus Omnitrophica bacterium]|nr:30S ribosomal protein S17 [Candidatus Omnitrophota bacterium]HOX54725.1 30S ribosomal protein S17 [Candidatus Omnitrophota bacterium]